MAARSLFAIGNFLIEHFEAASEGKSSTKEEPLDFPGVRKRLEQEIPPAIFQIKILNTLKFN